MVRLMCVSKAELQISLRGSSEGSSIESCIVTTFSQPKKVCDNLVACKEAKNVDENIF